MGEIKKGVANNAPKAACPTCPLTTQHTIKQDVRALANGQCKNTTIFIHRNILMNVFSNPATNVIWKELIIIDILSVFYPTLLCHLLIFISGIAPKWVIFFLG